MCFSVYNIGSLISVNCFEVIFQLTSLSSSMFLVDKLIDGLIPLSFFNSILFCIIISIMFVSSFFILIN